MNLYYNRVLKIKQHIQSRHTKNLLTIGLGTLIAQFIPVIAAPLLSRLFSPEDFGVYANYSALIAFLVVINTGKYELAIILPKEHKDAINIVVLSFFILILTTISLTLLFAILLKPIALLIESESSLNWIILAPIGAFFANSYLIINEWYIRNDNYKGLSKNRIGNTLGITGTSVFFGFLKQGWGLIFGQTFGQIISIFLALRRIFSRDKLLFKFISKRKIGCQAKRHINFAKYIMPGQLLNTTSALIAISLITFKFGLFYAGLIALIDRVFGVPSSIVGSAVNDVFKLQITETYREKGNCLKVYKKVVLMLFIVAAIPFIALYFISPIFFPFIFGEEWTLAGDFAQVFCFMFLLNFVSMPTRWVFMVAEKQHLEFIWQILFFIFSLGPIVIGVLKYDVFTTLILWNIGKSISYLIYLGMTFFITKNVLTIAPTENKTINNLKNRV